MLLEHIHPKCFMIIHPYFKINRNITNYLSQQASTLFIKIQKNCRLMDKHSPDFNYLPFFREYPCNKNCCIRLFLILTVDVLPFAGRYHLESTRRSQISRFSRNTMIHFSCCSNSNEVQMQTRTFCQESDIHKAFLKLS